MGWRLRKRLRILRGVWINLSKRGGSLSVGGSRIDGQHLKEGPARDRRATGNRYQLSDAPGRRKPRQPISPETFVASLGRLGSYALNRTWASSGWRTNPRQAGEIQQA
jgi:Protein of unknown function (DUF4236)